MVGRRIQALLGRKGKASEVPDKEECMAKLSLALMKLKSHNEPREYMAALSTLHVIVSHILEHPEQKRFRRLKKEHPAIERLAGKLGGHEAMLAIGFETEKKDSDTETTYVMKGFNKKKTLLLESSEFIHAARVQMIGDDSNSVMSTGTKRGVVRRFKGFLWRARTAKTDLTGRHHHNFVHKILQHCFHEDPVDFFIQMAHDRSYFLSSLWNELCANCDWTGFPGFDVNDVLVQFRVVNGQRLMLITMPPLPPSPRDRNCAYFAAAVLQVGKKGRKATARFFTLEKPQGHVGGREAKGKGVLCEWAPNGVHYDYDILSRTNEDAFMVAVTDMLGGPVSTTTDESRKKQTIVAAA